MHSSEHLESDRSLVVTDAGLETWLTFDRGFDLPAFAAYPLVGTSDGRAALMEYYAPFRSIASAAGLGVQLDAPTWRANPDWGEALGHDRSKLAQLIRASVDLVTELRSDWHGKSPMVVGGAVGPRGDGYVVGATMNVARATDYHSFQADCLASAGVDVLTAMTIGYVDEAVGIARAAERAGLPVVMSFTVETDGRLPSGMPLGEAIEVTDDRTSGYPSHYMINCAHPTHFDHALTGGEPWTERIGGIRANASTLSHAELDEATVLDSGDPDDLAARYVALETQLPNLRVVGGCCGTDHRHVAAIISALSTRAPTLPSART